MNSTAGTNARPGLLMKLFIPVMPPNDPHHWRGAGDHVYETETSSPRPVHVMVGHHDQNLHHTIGHSGAPGCADINRYHTARAHAEMLTEATEASARGNTCSVFVQNLTRV